MPHRHTTFREAVRFPEGLRQLLITSLKFLLFCAGMLYLAACGTPEPPTQSSVTPPAADEVVASATRLPIDAPTDTPSATSTAAVQLTTAPPTVTPVPEPADWSQTVTIDGDLFVLGNPAAPIRLVDYSDFM